MGDLARRRSARELWISRGHLAAGAVVVLLAIVLAFGVGYLVGRGAPEPPHRVAFTEQASSGQLVDVLARVDASVRSDDGVRALTFPDALTAPVEGDAPPPGRFTIEVGRFGAIETAAPLRDHLREAGLAAWIGAERLDGAPSYRVAVGGWADEGSAARVLQGVVDAMGSFQGPAGIPHVVERPQR